MTSIRLRLAIWLSGALALALPAEAAERKMMGLTFDAPGAGWEQKPISDGMIFQRLVTYDRKKGGAMMAFTTQRLAVDFDQGFMTVLNSLDIAKDKKTQRHEKGTTTNGIPMQWALKCCRLGETPGSQTLVAFHRDGQMIYGQLLMYNLEDDDEDKAEAEFDRVVSTFDFAGLGLRPPVPAPQPPGEAITGLYLNVSSRLQLNPFGGTDFVVDSNTYYFEPGGLFATEPPSGASDLAGFCPTKPEECGTYTLAGGKITLNSVSDRFGIMETEVDDFARKDGSLEIGGADFHPVAPVSNLKLDGSWTYFWASSGSTATNSGSVSSSKTIVFTPDGRYTRSGFSGATSTSQIGDTSVGTTHGSEQPEQAGTYTIDGYTLALKGDDGKSETLGIYLPDAKDIDVLMINGSSYLRDGRDED